MCPDRVGARSQLPACDIARGDQGYDSNALRRRIEREGAMPNIPTKSRRKWKNRFSPGFCRNRNGVERIFCRLTDFRLSQRAMIETPQTSLPLSASPQPSAIGYESGP